MADVIKITGVQSMVRKLNSARNKLSYGIDRGLVKGGQYLQAESQRICPVQTGNLHASAFTRKSYIGKHHVIVGYTANYAAYVHEDLSKAHGKEFNIKHADEIARAGTIKTVNDREIFKPTKGKLMGTAAGGMPPRGENQQAKFLERPMKEKRDTILRIVAREAGRI